MTAHHDYAVTLPAGDEYEDEFRRRHVLQLVDRRYAALAWEAYLRGSVAGLDAQGAYEVVDHIVREVLRADRYDLFLKSIVRVAQDTVDSLRDGSILRDHFTADAIAEAAAADNNCQTAAAGPAAVNHVDLTRAARLWSDALAGPRDVDAADRLAHEIDVAEVVGKYVVGLQTFLGAAVRLVPELREDCPALSERFHAVAMRARADEQAVAHPPEPVWDLRDDDSDSDVVL